MSPTARRGGQGAVPDGISGRWLPRRSRIEPLGEGTRLCSGAGSQRP
jgi:hypothetical protein